MSEHLFFISRTALVLPRLYESYSRTDPAVLEAGAEGFFFFFHL